MPRRWAKNDGAIFYLAPWECAGTWELGKERLRVRGAGWEKHGGVSFSNNDCLGSGKGHKRTEL